MNTPSQQNPPVDMVALRAARPADLALLSPLVEAYHAFEGIDLSADRRQAALERLLADSRLGGVWLVETRPAPAEGAPRVIGYIALCFGFSIEFAGIDSFVDELFLVEEVRGRGIGARVLELIADKARERGVSALHLEVDRANRRAQRLYHRSGFRSRERYMLMSRHL